MQGTPAIGRIGIWSTELRFGDPAAARGAAAALEGMGYGALWVPGGIGGDITGDVDRLLGATTRIPVCTGIINIWKHEPEDIAAWWHTLVEADRRRLLLSLGVSHGPLIGEAWARPLGAMRGWIARATAAGIPAAQLCVAALGPKMLALSGEITAGAHPYLITPAHTAEARAILGAGALLAPEQGVILEADPARARHLAAEALTLYRRLPNYVASWRRLGFSEAEIEECQPRLLEAIFAMGSASQIAARVQEHLNAGADHVCLQVIHGAGLDMAVAMGVWRELAGELL